MQTMAAAPPSSYIKGSADFSADHSFPTGADKDQDLDSEFFDFDRYEASVVTTADEVFSTTTAPTADTLDDDQDTVMLDPAATSDPPPVDRHVWPTVDAQCPPHRPDKIVFNAASSSVNELHAAAGMPPQSLGYLITPGSSGSSTASSPRQCVSSPAGTRPRSVKDAEKTREIRRKGACLHCKIGRVNVCPSLALTKIQTALLTLA